MEANLRLDARSYVTAFRVNDKAGTGELPELIAGLPEGTQRVILSVFRIRETPRTVAVTSVANILPS
jgi:hypothetical protein